MKIAFLTDGIYPYFKGGKEERIHQITARLSQRGHDVHIYTMNWWKGEKVMEENGITYHAISPLYSMYTKSGRRSIKQALLFSLNVFPKMLGEKFDVLEADSMPHFPVIPAWFISKISSAKFFVTWHEFWGKYWFKYLGAAGLFGTIIERLAAMFSTKALVVSEMTGKRLPVENQVLVPNGITTKLFSKIKPSPKKWDLSFVGRLVKHKNVELLVKVANQTGLNTIIMGSGPEEKYLKSIAQRNIYFTGFIEDSEDVFSNIKSSKVFVNLSEREGFGISFIESMACGTPVVMSNHINNAGRFLIEKGKNGYAVELEKNTIIKAIEKVIKNRAKMKNFSRVSVQSFDWDKIVDKLEVVYNG
jgi:L-malate glycosyltransferase